MSSLKSLGTDEEKSPKPMHVSNALNNDRDAQFGGTEARNALEKKLLRKVDLRMCILIVIYILNYVSRAAAPRETITHLILDRQKQCRVSKFTGVSGVSDLPFCRAARLRGFEDDLGLKGNEFPTLLSILYVGYIIMQVPS